MKYQSKVLFLSKCLLLSIASAMTAQADELPERKAGLWEIKMSRAGMPEQTSRQCTDPSVEKKMRDMVLAGGAMNCSKMDIRKTSSGYAADAICSMFNPVVMSITSHTEYTGDFNSAYTMKQTGRLEMGKTPPRDTSMSISAKWLGACPAGWKPGDIEMPNGGRMNLQDIGVRK
jgi:hypothetical protein